MVRNGLNNRRSEVRCPNDLKWARGRQLCWLHDAPHVPGDSNWFTESARLGTSLARPHSADKSWLQVQKRHLKYSKHVHHRSQHIYTYLIIGFKHLQTCLETPWNTLKRFVLARVLFWSSTASWNLLSLRKSSFACLELPRQPMWAVYLLMSHYNLTKAYESIHLQVQAFPSLPETISVPCKNRCYLCLSPIRPSGLFFRQPAIRFSTSFVTAGISLDILRWRISWRR